MARNYRTTGRRRRLNKVKLIVVLLALAFLIAAGIFLLNQCAPEGGIFPKPSNSMGIADDTPLPTPTPTPRYMFEPQQDKLGVRAEMEIDGNSAADYERADPIYFPDDEPYSALEGITTFRGNQLRDTATFGSPSVTEAKLEPLWSVKTGALPKAAGSGYWSGAGWTGQPIIVKWPDATRKIMNLNEAKKDKSGLVEIIYAEEDGKVRFLDLEDGKVTRETLDVGISFKGSGSIDPRGYPLLYVGAGDSVPAHNGKPAMQQQFFIYSLIDFKQLYTFGENPDPYSQRTWHAYDSAALVHAASDTLIEPGENGILYTMKLNTDYSEANGTISIKPGNILKFRYTSQRQREGMENNTYWLGMESSAAFLGPYMFVADNGGTLLCLDVNTMKVVWSCDTLDDTNCSPVVEVEGKNAYIYISTSLHWTKNKDDKGIIPIWKIDARTGKKVWETPYECSTVTDHSGGVQSTALVGKNSLDGLVYVSIARYPSAGTSTLVALNKSDGKEVWRFKMDNYTWSSPVAVYSSEGKGYVIICDNSGNMHLLDGLTGPDKETGAALHTIKLAEGAIEASPVVYGDKIVVGSRDQNIYCAQIK